MSGVFILIISMLLISHLTSATIYLHGKQIHPSFSDLQANFTPVIKGSDRHGVLYVSDPPDGCSDLANSVIGSNVSSHVLIIRGGCSYEYKVRNAQKAGFKAAIVYDNEDNNDLLTRNSSGVNIYATFVSKATGEVLKDNVGSDLWLVPEIKISVIAIFFMIFSVIFLMLVIVLVYNNIDEDHRRVRILSLSGGGFPRVAKDLLRKIPTMVFNGVCDESSTSVSCAICIEDYCIGDKLRILPCNHKFHVGCIDLWLGQRRSFCPVCKLDARAISIDMPPSEETPLLTPYTV